MGGGPCFRSIEQDGDNQGAKHVDKSVWVATKSSTSISHLPPTGLINTQPYNYVGDFNSHHLTWGYERADSKGDWLMEWASQLNLSVVIDLKQNVHFTLHAGIVNINQTCDGSRRIMASLYKHLHIYWMTFRTANTCPLLPMWGYASH